MSAFAVTRCYTVGQEGTFFEGSGYAALGMYYQHERNLWVQPALGYGPKNDMLGQDSWTRLQQDHS